MKQSIREYKSGQTLQLTAYDCGANPFYSLLQATMRCADGSNLALLKTHWPAVWEDLQARYNAPGGVLDTDE